MWKQRGAVKMKMRRVKKFVRKASQLDMELLHLQVGKLAHVFMRSLPNDCYCRVVADGRGSHKSSKNIRNECLADIKC